MRVPGTPSELKIALCASHLARAEASGCPKRFQGFDENHCQQAALQVRRVLR